MAERDLAGGPSFCGGLAYAAIGALAAIPVGAAIIIGALIIHRELSFDESGFSPNPPVQYGWTPIGQTRSAVVESKIVNLLTAKMSTQDEKWP